MIKMPIKTVLLIEDDAEQAHLISDMFNDQGSYSFALTRVKCMADAEAHFAGQSVSVVLLDLDCPGASGLNAILQIHATLRCPSIVLLSRPQDEAVAMSALEDGVQDYLIKGQIEPREMMRALRNSVSRKILEEALTLEKNRAQITLNSIGDAVICTDNSGNISFLNPTAERMTAGGSSRSPTDGGLSHHGCHYGQACFRSHNKCYRAWRDLSSACELHPYTARRTSGIHRGLCCSHPRRKWSGRRIRSGLSRCQ
jgi:CheY-like chemotaxis protein